MKNVTVEIFGSRNREYCACVFVGKNEVFRIDFMSYGVKETGKLDDYAKAMGASAVVDRLLQGKVDDLGCPVTKHGIW